MKLVSFVILHFRDRNMTDSCVKSILEMEGQERIRIVIVDNDIRREEEERRKLAGRYQRQPRITYLPIRENGGFSYANNQGYRYARDVLKSSWIVAANNDVLFPQPEFLRLLEESYKEHPCHVMGPDILCQKNGNHQNPLADRLRTRREAEFTVRMNRWALRLYPLSYPMVSLLLKRSQRREEGKRLQKPAFCRSFREDAVLFGACLIFTPDFVRKEGAAFVPETPFFYEEYILAHRCRKQGYKMAYDPSLRVWHKGGSETGQTFRKKTALLRFRMERTAQSCETYLKLLREDSEDA